MAVGDQSKGGRQAGRDGVGRSAVRSGEGGRALWGSLPVYSWPQLMEGAL